eukprot:CAMPEP_0183338228 /NCGR_PEP_ID=MMETSP0164_2-20130417/5600_1 /TAXON_ID=221442 /ORGANISM="Coccolithus pelagicus ssp braarudi, Strain PLY182g" /LENGTH=49 /DNA_ID=CAMNT_0025508047 /DNA_START=116 /DNA_END=265 /DNA_ORIENTATION=+
MTPTASRLFARNTNTSDRASKRVQLHLSPPGESGTGGGRQNTGRDEGAF